MARWREPDVFPERLRTFREADWPPVEGECLGVYACRDAGYEVDCVAAGGPCGYRFRAAVAEEYPGQAAVMLARARRADAYERWRRARLAHLGEDHPDYVDEFIRGFQAEREIRFGRGHAGQV